MVSIRRYKETDRPALRAFALAHAPEGFADKKGSTELYPAIYLDYYLEYEPENTLVAEDEDGTLAGYIVCSNDYNCFCRKMVGYVKRHVAPISYGEVGRIDELMAAVRKLHPGLTTHCFLLLSPDYLHQGLFRDLLTAEAGLQAEYKDPYLAVLWVEPGSHRHGVLSDIGFEDFGTPDETGTVAMILDTEPFEGKAPAPLKMDEDDG